MKKIVFIAVILSVIILTGCFNDLANGPLEENRPDELYNKPYADLSVEEADFQKVNPFEGINSREKSIYGAGEGKILIRSDKLYLFDVKDQTIVAEAPLKRLELPTYYTTKSGYWIVGTEVMEDQRITKAYFYNENLDIIQEFNLTEILGPSPRTIAISQSGKKIAYATNNGLFLYDLTEETKQSLFNLGLENIEVNEGLVSFRDITFFDNDTKLAFMGTSFEENDMNGQTTFGIISIDGSVVFNEKALLPRLQHMGVSDDYLAFSEGLYPFGTGAPVGEVIMIDNATQQIIRHTLMDKDEGSNIFLSEKGKYFMTYLQKGSSEIIYKIYDSKTGDLIQEMEQKFFGEAAENYMRTYIEIFDDSHTFIAVSTFYEAEPVVAIHEF